MSDLKGYVKAGMLVVGDEILLGMTQDTNTIGMADYLLKRGIRLKRWVIAPDEENEIILSLRRLIDDGFSPVMISGGMGPTHDDLTVPSVAKALGLEIVRSEDSFQRMYEKWKGRHPGEEMEESSRKGLEKMAHIPRGFDCIENSSGMAEGLVGRPEGTDAVIFILPGVPGEYRSVMENRKFLENLPDHRDGNVSIVEMPYNGRESQIAALLERFQRDFPPVEIGSYPRGQGEVMVRITGTPDDVERARSILAAQLEEMESGNRRC